MSCKHTRSLADGFEILTLSNGIVGVSCAPALGARVVSIRDLAAGREWLDGWSPVGERRIGRPADPADFSTGPGAGLDECLPTVLPCEAGHRKLPDHGELWNRAANVSVDAGEGSMTCRWTLESLPLAFSRVISMVENRLLFEYRLENLADEPTPFQWAWHPLFTYREGDHLRFQNQPATCLDPGGAVLPWPASAPGCDLSRGDLTGAAAKCAKVFVGPLETARVRIETATGCGLDIEWLAEWFPYAGIWITRGGWKGLHHWAIEPTNVPVDRLSDAIGRPDLERLASLRPRECRAWHVHLTFGRAH